MTHAGGPALSPPTERMRMAHHLGVGQGLTDAQVGRVLGCGREWACKLRSAYRRRTAALAGRMVGAGTLDPSVVPLTVGPRVGRD